MSAPRRWARRAVLSVLAGGASLSGPFSHGALGAEAPTSTTSTGEAGGAPVTETTPQAPAPEASTTPQQSTPQPTTTTSTTPTTTPASTTPASTTSAPPASEPAAAAPTTTQPAAPQPTAAPTVVVQRGQRTTRGSRRGAQKNQSSTGGQTQAGQGNGGQGAAVNPKEPTAGGPNGVAPAPQAVGGEAGALASLLAESAASKQALDFYRVPLFLLPIYQAAAIQYDVPWQILAAINEVETDFGTDQSVSTAGAVGWMQFMPQTWLLYGVDATDAGYADPYNPIDAVFAAARYLHAAGAAKHLRQAIFAYNHSQAYVESVLLRARLIASYPSGAIATLTGLVDGRLPTYGAKPAPGAVYLPGSAAAGSAGAAAGSTAATESAAATGAGTAAGAGPAAGSTSATAGALPASPLAAGAAGVHEGGTANAGQGAANSGQAAANAGTATGTHAAALPGSTPPPPPQVLAARAAARAQAAANAPATPAQLLDLAGRPGAPVIAVQGGRVVQLGDTRALGRYLVLRDLYGDVFTYAGLGSIEPRHPRPKPPSRPANLARPASAPAPTLPASAGHQPPQTLQVKSHPAPAAGAAAASETEVEGAPAGLGKVRLYAHPGNPLARAAAARAARSASAGDGRWLPLKVGSLVAQGTVLGHLSSAPAADAGQLRFAVRPAGDSSTVDPAPLLANWGELSAALHPAGSRGTSELLGATADQVFQMSRSELQLSLLADPGVQLDACARRDIAAGAVDRRVLAALEFLSRNGLQPTVSGLRCLRQRQRQTAAGAAASSQGLADGGAAVEISAINGIPVAGHQGPGSLTDATIRTLLTLPPQLAPRRILSLMHYPQATTTLARASAWNHIEIDFAPPASRPHGARAAAHTAKQSPAAGTGGSLSATEWNRLIERIAGLPQPNVAVKPSPAAIRDPRSGSAGGGLGARP